MNVLVYSNPEVIDASYTQTISTLRSLLAPNYSVQTVTKQSLASHPWVDNCAALVFPACRQQFTSSASDIISTYVDNGGLLLAFSSGAYFSSPGTINPGAQLPLSADSKEKPLRFINKTSGTSLYLSCLNPSDPKIVSVYPADGKESCEAVYQGGKGEIVGTEGKKNVTVLARYISGDNGDVAAASYSLGSGKVIALLPGFEYSLLEVPASSAIAASDAKNLSDDPRKDFVRNVLRSHGLQAPSSKAESEHRPLPLFLVSPPEKPEIVTKIAGTIHMTPTLDAQPKILQDSNDIFHFHNLDDGLKILRSYREESTDSPPSQPKHIIVCQGGELPGPADTPLFDLKAFFDALSAARANQSASTSNPDSWGMGEALLYSEVVTSTQTMLDKNQELLTKLPTPIVFVASHQLTGRGRGANLWLSPSGCLQFSVLRRLSLSSFPANKMVFIQYLFALAVVEACRDETVMGPKEGEKIRLKWPNDIYAVTEGGERKKVGGILVNTSFANGNIDIVIGCGINVLTPPPIYSLSQAASSATALSMERTLAAILSKFEVMWGTFVKENGSFDSFMDTYLRRWLHSDQAVLLTTLDPPQKVRIVGITSNHGLLRTIPERGAGHDFIDLQPDGNSFDLMAGLIKSKTT